MIFVNKMWIYSRQLWIWSNSRNCIASK